MEKPASFGTSRNLMDLTDQRGALDPGPEGHNRGQKLLDDSEGCLRPQSDGHDFGDDRHEGGTHITDPAPDRDGSGPSIVCPVVRRAPITAELGLIGAVSAR